MKKILTLLITLILFLNGHFLILASDADDKQQISNLLHAVYKEKTKQFLQYDCKNNKENKTVILNYYKRFFTDDTALVLTATIERSKKNEFGCYGAFAQDPRYGDDVGYEPEENTWFPNDKSRKGAKLEFSHPVISGNEAVASVDTLIGHKGLMYRSEFHLIKTPKGWRIDNIIWGLGPFDEPSTQGLDSIKDYTHWGDFYYNSAGKIEKK